MSPTVTLKTGMHGVDGVRVGRYTRTDGFETYLHVGYYLSQRQGHELVNTENRLLADQYGRVIGRREITLSAAGGTTLEAREVTVSSGARDYLGWYWYDVDGLRTVSPLRVKARQVVNGFRATPTPGALVLLLVPMQGDWEQTRETLESFFQEIEPTISACLWQPERNEASCADRGRPD